MKKENLMNKHVVRAISVGLAAAMLSAPITAQAEEPDAIDNSSAEDVVQSQSNVADAAQEAAGNAEAAVEDAKTEINVVVDDINVNADGLDEDVKAAADAVDETNLADADTDIENANAQLDVAEANDGLAQDSADTAQAEADKAAAAADEAGVIADKANSEADDLIDNIEKASSTADAEEAYNTMVGYEEQFNAEVEKYNVAKIAAEEALAKVKEYEAAYDEAVANASANADAAAAELAVAKAEAEALEKELEKARASVEESAAYAIKQAEDAANTQSIDWKKEDKLFVAMMEKYYLPEELGIEGATVKRIQGKDNNEYNYFLVTYTDENGEIRESYYNYKLDENNQIVIFEKRDVEVNGDPEENPDQYRDEQNNVITEEVLQQGLDDGSIIQIDNKYYKMNDWSEELIIVENSEVTSSSTRDVYVDDASKEVRYVIDETTGAVVKEVTADVTTITYTEKTFTSSEVYDTDEERDAAAADKVAELEGDTGKDVIVIDVDTTVYETNGTYIPIFSANIDFEKDTILINENLAKNSATNSVEKEIESKLEDEGYYILGEIGFSNVSATNNPRKLDFTYDVSGTATVTYAKITKEEIDFSVWEGMLNIFSNDLEKAAKAWVAERNGLYVSSNWVNWNLSTATIEYVAGVKVEGETASTQDAAEASFDKAVNESLAVDNGNPYANATASAYNMQSTTTSETSYSYEVNYLEGEASTEQDVLISATEATEYETLKGEIVQNMNYLNKEFLLTQNDEEYREFVDEATELVNEYSELLEEAEDANAAVADAQEKVETLQEEISNLEAQGDYSADLEAQLAEAQKNLEDAQEEMDAYKEKLKEAADSLEETKEKLTQKSKPYNPSVDTDDTDDVNEAEEIVDSTPAVTVEEPVQDEEQALTTIEDEEVPLATGAVTEEVEDDKELMTIGDEEVPLAAMPTEEEKATMSWWWLLIVAVMGTTGYAMYKKHQKKKEGKEIKL